MSLVSRIARLTSSPQGRRLTEQAMRKARDPKTRAQIEQVRERFANKRGGGSAGGGRSR